MLTKSEIKDQPEVFHRIKESHPEILNDVQNFILKSDARQVGFIGCGSSYYLGMGLACHLNRLSSEEVTGHYYSGSEIMLGLRQIPADMIMVGISRSGESSETVAALKQLQKKGIKTVALTCEPDSSIVKYADVPVVLDFIGEKSIVMTKSFTAMAFSFSLLLMKLFQAERVSDYLNTVTASTQQMMEEADQKLDAVRAHTFEHYVLLGYDEYYSACMEGLVKLTETTLSEVDTYQTLEYRHGPKSKVRRGTLAFISSNTKTYDEEMKMAREIESLGGKVLIMTSEANCPMDSITFPDDTLYQDWFLRVIPLQLTGIKRAVEKGLNPDEPKNLSKVVKL